MRHKSAMSPQQSGAAHQSGANFNEELHYAASLAASKAGMSVEQWLATQLNQSQINQSQDHAQPQLRDELISGLTSMQRMLQAQQQSQYQYEEEPRYSPQQDAPPPYIHEMSETISSLKDEIFQLSQQMGQQAKPQNGFTPQNNSYAYPNARATHPDLELTLADIERRQNEIASGKKQPVYRENPVHQNSVHRVNIAPTIQKQALKPLDNSGDRQKTRQALDELRRDIGNLGAAMSQKSPNHTVQNLQDEVRHLARAINASSQHGSSPAQVQNYDNRLEAISSQLQSLRPLENLAGLEIEIHSLSKKLDNLSLREAPVHEVQALHKMITDLKSEMQQTSQVDALKSVSGDIRALSQQIERMWKDVNVVQTPNITGVELKLEQLSRNLALQQQTQKHDPATTQIRNELRQLAERFNQSTQDTQPNNDYVRGLEHKIDQLSQLVGNILEKEQPPLQHFTAPIPQIDPAQTEKMAALERMLTSVMVKIDRMQTPQVENAYLADFEKTLLQLANKIDATDQKFNQLTGLEQNIATMLKQAENARQLAENARQQPSYSAEPAAIPEHIAPIQNAQRAVDRLMDKIQPNTAYEPTAVAKPYQEAAPIAVTRPNFSRPIETGGLPHDMPLEVGSGAPRARSNLDDAAPSIMMNLRKNTQDTSLPMPKLEGKFGQEHLKNSGSSVISKLKDNKKKLLIGLAAFLLLFGGLKFIELMATTSKSINVGRVQEKIPENIVVSNAPQSDEPARVVLPSPNTNITTNSNIDNNATGSISTLPKIELPGVAVNNGWAPITPNAKEKVLQGTTQSLKKMAEGGNVSAQYELANRLMDGVDGTRNQAEALRLYKLAADASFTPAQFKLASLYEKGIGTAKNPVEARKYYLAAAGKGHAKAMHNLAVLTSDNSEGKADMRVSAQWFRRAAEMGVVDSQYNLAILYARGMGVEKSMVESYKWFALAAKGGDKDAANKRDDLATRLGDENLSAVKMAVETFVPKPEPIEATKIDVPEGGWEQINALVQNKRR